MKQRKVIYTCNHTVVAGIDHLPLFHFFLLHGLYFIANFFTYNIFNLPVSSNQDMLVILRQNDPGEREVMT